MNDLTNSSVEEPQKRNWFYTRPLQIVGSVGFALVAFGLIYFGGNEAKQIPTKQDSALYEPNSASQPYKIMEIGNSSVPSQTVDIIEPRANDNAKEVSLDDLLTRDGPKRAWAGEWSE